MGKLEDVVRVKENGEIALPRMILQNESLKPGDYLSITDMEGVILLRKMEARPTVIDLFKELGSELRQKGYDSREKVDKFIDDVKLEVANEWIRSE